jgi:hypothetical protein
MNKRQRAILEILDKLKSQPQPADLETVRQEYGSFAPFVFLWDWKALFDQRFVTGVPKINSDQVITGTGRITANGEKALEEICAKENPENPK